MGHSPQLNSPQIREKVNLFSGSQQQLNNNNNNIQTIAAYSCNGQN